MFIKIINKAEINLAIIETELEVNINKKTDLGNDITGKLKKVKAWLIVIIEFDLPSKKNGQLKAGMLAKIVEAAIKEFDWEPVKIKMHDGRPGHADIIPDANIKIIQILTITKQKPSQPGTEPNEHNIKATKLTCNQDNLNSITKGIICPQRDHNITTLK